MRGPVKEHLGEVEVGERRKHRLASRNLPEGLPHVICYNAPRVVETRDAAAAGIISAFSGASDSGSGSGNGCVLFAFNSFAVDHG